MVEQNEKVEAVKEKDLGNVAYKKQEFEKALEHYDKARELDPTNIAILNNMAAVLFEQGKYGVCIEVCEQAIEVGRKHHADVKLIARSYGRIGSAYLKLGKLNYATEYFNKSLTERHTPEIHEKIKEIESSTYLSTVGLTSIRLPQTLFKMPSSYTASENITKIASFAKVKPQLWLNSNLQYPLKFDVSLNTALDMDSGSLTLISCTTNEYFATLFLTDNSPPTVKITVYQSKPDKIHVHWQVDLILQDGKGKHLAINIDDSLRKPKLEGLLMNDGETLFLHVELDYNMCSHFLVKKDGNKAISNWVHQEREGWEFRCKDYHLSDDEHYLYIVRHGKTKNSKTNDFIVEAFPMANLNKVVKEWHIECYHDYIMTEVKLLRPIYFDEPLYVAIKSDDFDHIQVQGLNNDVSATLPIKDVFTYNSSQNVWISKNGKNLVFLPNKKRNLLYWDLTNLTYQPLQECILPGVESEQGVVIPKQERVCWFSPGGEVITVITANGCTVIVQIMLSWNLQIIDQMKIDYANINGYQVLSIGMSESNDLLIMGAIVSPTAPIEVMVSSINGIYDRVHKIEKYFDEVSNGIFIDDSKLIASWKITNTNHRLSITPQHVSSDLSNMDKIIRNVLYEIVFQSFNSYNRNLEVPLESEIADKVIHLLTFSYSWDEDNDVYVFAVKGDHTLMIIAVRLLIRQDMPSDFAEICIRMLYTNDNLFNLNFTFEITECENCYLLTASYGSELTSYGEVVNAMRTSMVITDFNIKHDSSCDIFSVSESRMITLHGWYTSPNMIIANSSTFCGYVYNYKNDDFSIYSTLRFGNKRRNIYSASKLELWLSYVHRNRQNDIILGPGKFTDMIASCYDVFDDVSYNDKDWPFPCVFAGAMNLDRMSNSTLLTDEFLKKYHESKELVIRNTITITYCIPAACQIQPLGVQTFLSHIALWTMDVKDMVVNVHNDHALRTTKSFIRKKFIEDPFTRLVKRFRLLQISISYLNYFFSLIQMLILMSFRNGKSSQDSNITKCTLPLAGFCSYNRQIFQLSKSYENENSHIAALNNLVSSIYGQCNTYYQIKEPHRLFAESPFSCLVDEILALNDETLQFDFFEIIWFQKLLRWKLNKFARRKYIERLMIPMIINFITHLLSGYFVTQNIYNKTIAAIQLIVIIYLGFQELRQLITQVKYWKSILNYFDLITIGLGFTMVIQIFAGKQPSENFIAYSTAFIWINVLLQFRFYEPIGVLLIVLTDMIKGITWYLLLLIVLLLGLTYIPFILDKGNFGSNFVKIILEQYDSFTELEDFVVPVLSKIVMFVLLLNVLIALLNLRVESTTMKGKTKWLRQVAEMIVEIERYFLTPGERNRSDWFPTWFKYNVTESEKKEWKKWMELKSNEWLPIDTEAKNKMETLDQSIKEIKSMLQQLHQLHAENQKK